jgi:GR25 family glycosyltransferase involved in LPS biosynthesis
MKINVDKIYICHYHKLTDRKKAMMDQLDEFGMTEYVFVENFDKDSWDIKSINEQYPKINAPETRMSPAEKSLALKHSWIVQDTQEKGYSSVLVLEDDAVLCKNFVEHFNRYKQQLPEDWDIGWVGSCFHLREPHISGVNVYKTNRGSRCGHAYCLSRQFAVKMAKEFRNINLPADTYYNYIVKNFSVNNYWFQPPLALQSLEFCSSLNENPNHKWNPQEMG